jgi:hypothetical protein
MTRLAFAHIIPAAALGALLASVGCAGAPRPTAELAQAHSLVDQAEQGGATQYASADLSMARSKLQQADLEAQKQPEQSLRSAQEASADARVALARTNAAKAQAALRDVDASTQTLREETGRESSRNDAAAPGASPTPAPTVPSTDVPATPVSPP